MNSNYKILIGLLGLILQSTPIKGSSQDLQTQILELQKKNAQQAKTIETLTIENESLKEALETAQRDKKLCQTSLFKQTTTPTYHS